MVEGAVLVGSCSRNQLKASFLEEIKDIQLELQIGRAQGGKRAFLCMKSCLTRYIALHCLTLSYMVHCFTSAFSLTHNIYLRRPSWPWFIDTFSGNLYWSWCSYWGWLLWPCGMSWVKISTSNDISLLQELLSELNINIMFVSMIPIVIPMIWL